MIRLLLFTALSTVVFHLQSLAQSVDLEAVSIRLENVHLQKSEFTDIIVTIKQNGPQDLPPGSARIVVAINSDILRWLTPLLVRDNLGNLWKLHTSAVGTTSSQIQLRNDNTVPFNAQSIELRLPVLCISEGVASLLVQSAVFGVSLSDPDGDNQSKTSNQSIVSPYSKFTSFSKKTISSQNPPVEINQEIYFYPNPVKDRLKIKGGAAGLPVSGKIKLLNNRGQVVHDSENISVEGIDISHLPPGLYLVRITDKNGSSAISKVVKQ